MAVSLHTSQSGSRALFPPLTAFFESPYEKDLIGPVKALIKINNCSCLSRCQISRLPHFFTFHPHFSTLIYYYNLKNCITSET